MWAALTLPGTGWLAVFFVVPFYAIAAVAFGGFDLILARPGRRWNPFDWQFHSFWDILDDVFTGTLGRVMVRTFWYVVIATALCFVDRVPGGVLRGPPRRPPPAPAARVLILPFWMSYLMRMLAWVNLLNPEGGWAAAAAELRATPRSSSHWLRLGDGSDTWFTQPITVVLGLVYGYIPFFILPLYAGLDRLDDTPDRGVARPRGVARGRRSCASPCRCRCRRCMAAVVITALPMFGDYYTNTILSGSPRTTMIGNQIESLHARLAAAERRRARAHRVGVPAGVRWRTTSWSSPARPARRTRQGVTDDARPAREPSRGRPGPAGPAWTRGS